MPTVKALKSFYGRREEGGYVKRGRSLTIDAARHAELAGNGLVEPAAPRAKAAPVPLNKMAPPPENKAPDPPTVPSVTVRRRGRPPKAAK